MDNREWNVPDDLEAIRLAETVVPATPGWRQTALRILEAIAHRVS